MDPRSNFDGLVASVTFTGSLLSLLATTAVLISYIYYRHEQRSFRHALVFNLALAGMKTHHQLLIPFRDINNKGGKDGKKRQKKRKGKEERKGTKKRLKNDAQY